MYTLDRARARERSAGEPLTDVWRRLAAQTVRFRRGQLHIVASGPGVGKSAFALTLAIASGSTAIYMSADSDIATQYARSVSMLTGDLVSEVQRNIEAGKVDGYNEVLEDLYRIRFDFNAGPTLTDIEETVLAYAHIHFRYPELLIVDNLSNVVDENGGEGFQSLENILAFLHDLARKTKTCIVVLHHLTGEYENGNVPPPLSALRGKVSKLPEVVLNLYRAVEDTTSPMGVESLGVAIVKNRGGRANGAAQLRVMLVMDLERMSITDGVDSMDHWVNMSKGNI